MISHLHKIIFIHIPKCAGRSISHALQEDFGHHTAYYYQTNFPDQWQSYTVFTTVRNPYKRLVSMYHYIKNEPFHAAHPITNTGNMIPFTDWVMENITLFQNEFDYHSPEGNRETDGEKGSPFWFSSQVRRLSPASLSLYPNIHVLRYEDGMAAVENFLHEKKNIRLNIAHLNNSNSNRNSFLTYYNSDLLKAINSFPPFITDCVLLNYEMIT